jgi:hypothetical protein
MLAEAPTVTLPFGALRGAGLELESIRALDVAEDTWLELEREARTLAELPRWRRTETYTVELEAPTLEAIPEKHRRHWRALTDAELAEREARVIAERGPDSSVLRYMSSHDTLPRLPDADGMYRWTVERRRDVSPDADGIYRYTETAHVLGEATFTAARTENGRRRRAKYLSGFDTNESPALYFLAELPSGAPNDIEGARLSLAPPAVHGAIARGRIVERQGDIFLVDTELTRAELEARGAEFARLTLWSRDAKPRAGEATYRAPLSKRTLERRARREARRRREIWRESFSQWTADAIYRAELERARSEAREDMRRRWRELEARQRAELEQYGARALAPCGTCGAGIGEDCARLPDADSAPPDMPARLFGAECYGARRRLELAAVHTSERSELAHESRRRKTVSYVAPSSGAGIRKRTAERRASARARLERTAEDMRRAVFSAPELRTDWRKPREGGAYARRAPSLAEARSDVLSRLERARRAYDGALGEYRRELYSGARAEARDEYRRAPRVAAELYYRARDAARVELRPETDDSGARWTSRRDAIRAAVSIYGTAHTATELARVKGAVYVRGTVTHRPELERGRFGAPDHRPLLLTPDRWYLAVRNTVPRARSVDNAR